MVFGGELILAVETTSQNVFSALQRGALKVGSQTSQLLGCVPKMGLTYSRLSVLDSWVVRPGWAGLPFIPCRGQPPPFPGLTRQ